MCAFKGLLVAGNDFDVRFNEFGDNYLVINGEQLKEYGASIGFGVPLRRSLSTTNFYFDITRKTGAAGSSLHTENYFTFGISLNLYDFWFIKRKYD